MISKDHGLKSADYGRYLDRCLLRYSAQKIIPRLIELRRSDVRKLEQDNRQTLQTLRPKMTQTLIVGHVGGLAESPVRIR